MQKFFVYLVSLGHLCVDLAPGALPAVLPFLVLYNGLSYTEVAGLMFASSCLASLTQPLFGYWSDKRLELLIAPQEVIKPLAWASSRSAATQGSVLDR